MDTKTKLPDEFLDAVSGGIMMVGGEDVESYEIADHDGTPAIVLTTVSGKSYSLEGDSGVLPHKFMKSICAKSAASPKDRYIMDRYGFKPMAD